MYLTHGSRAGSVEGFGDRDGRRGARGTEDHREVRGIGDSSESLVGSDPGDIAGKQQPRTCRADAAPHDGRRPGRGQEGAGCQRRFPVITARSMDCSSEPGVIAAGAGALPGARRRCEAGKRTYGRGPRACLALLAATALLAMAAPAQAQTEVWSATITPQLVSSGGGFSDVLGCDNASSNTAAACSETSVLSDDDFTYNSTTYVIRKFTLQGTYATAAFDSALTDTDDLYFRVTHGNPSVPNSHRYHPFYNTVVAESGASFGWSPGNINPWRVDRDVSLAILHLIQPPRPTGLTATANGQFQIDLAWTAPDNPGGLFDITGYQIEASSDGGTTWFFLIGGSAFDLVSTATTYSDTGLEPGTTRHYRVETKNHAVSSVPLSDVADATATTASTNTARVTSIVRQTPASSPTNANSLTWRVTFSEAVSNVDATDFAVSGTTATLTVAAVSGVTGAYDVTASGGNLADLSATVTLSFAAGQNIQDAANNTLTNTAPTGTNDHTYVLDNTAPTVTITGVPGTSSAPFTATFTFSEAVTGFVVGDITLGNATASNFTVTSTTVYTALITPTANGTVTVDVAVNVAQDAVGNDNTAATQASSTYTAPMITIEAGTSPVTEGTSAAFTLSRAGSTTAALTVNATVSETGGDMVAPANEGARTVTFQANSATATLSVPTVADQVDEADGVVTATVTADTATPATYTAGTPSTATVTVSDDDTRGVTVSAETLPVNEGSTGTYMVVLNSQPTASVTVTPSSDNSDVAVSSALTFTTTNWNMAQPVTVTAAQDSDAVDGAATISHAVMGGDYGAVTAASVAVTVDDDEVPDTTAPTVTSIVRQTPASSPTNANSLTWRVTFSEAVSNVDATDFAVSGTTATLTVAAVSGVTGAYDVTASGGNLADLSATVTLSFAAGQNIQDAANNTLTNTAPTGTNDHTYVLDNTVPTVTSIVRQIPASSPTNANSLTWRVTFSEAVSNVDATDFAVSGTTATLTVAAVSGVTGAYDVTASGGNLADLSATVTLSFAAGQNIQDAANNTLTNTAPTGTNDHTYVLDNTVPTVTSIVRQIPASSPTNANSLTWRVTFSEAVSNVDATDFAVSGTTATLTVAAVSGVTGAYDVTASGGNLADLSATVTLSFAAGQNIQDAANNTLTNTAPTGTNDHTYVLDNTAPTVTITGVPGTSSAPFTATFTFSEAVTGFVVGDITLGNATASNFTVTSTTVYTALITPTANGTVTVDVAVNVAQDAVGNDNTAATQASSTYTAPMITIEAGTSPVTEGTSAAFTLSRAGSTTAALTVNATVSETGGDMVAPANEGARTVTFQANSATATLSVPTVADQVDEADGVVTATVTADTATPATYTAGTPSTATVTVSDDDTRGVTVSAETLPVNEGSTGTYMVVLNSQPTASVTVTPSSDNSDVAVSSALTFTTTNWNMAQPVTVTAAQDSDAVDGAATISHAVMGGDYGAVTAASVAVTVDDDEVPDTTAPTVTSIVRQTPASSPTNANSLTWRVTFSEAVSNVDATDFAVSGTTATLTVAAVSGVTGAYDVTASGGNLADLSATVTLSFAAGQNIQDAANNTLTNTAPTGTNDHTYVLDNTAPTVTITGVPGTSSAPFTATFTFSEAVTGFVVGDITLGNATASNFTVTSTTVYTALITPTANGTVTVDVAVNVAQDAVGNDNTAATQASSTYSGRRGPSVPGAPASLTATAGDEEVALVWSAPADDGGSPVTGYEYRFAAGTTVPGDTPWQSAGLDLEWTVTGLTNGQQYAFEVRASNRVGEGEARGALATPVGAPGALASLTATAGDEEVALVWSAPADDGGSPVTGYEYRFAAGTTVPGDTPWQSAGLDLEWTVTGLTNGQQYAFEVRASNRVGEGEARGALATPVGAPGALASLTATAGDEEVALVWSAPADDGGTPVTGYEYRFAAGTTVPGDTPWQSAGLDLEWTISGLTNGQQYAFEVRARNRVGPGETSGTTALPLRLRAELFSTAVLAAEGEALVVGVRRSGRLAFPAHASIGVTDSALPGVTATEEGRDDGLGRHRLEFAAGAAEATVTVTVAFDGERRQDRVLSATLDSAELEVDGVRRPYELVTPTLVVPVTEGDAGLSVADARVQGKSSVLAFTVSMDRTRDVAVRVDYATEDGSARAGEDYTPVSGTLTLGSK